MWTGAGGKVATIFRRRQAPKVRPVTKAKRTDFPVAAAVAKTERVQRADNIRAQVGVLEFANYFPKILLGFREWRVSPK